MPQTAPKVCRQRDAGAAAQSRLKFRLSIFRANWRCPYGQKRENVTRAVAWSLCAGESSPIGTDPRALPDAGGRVRQSLKRFAHRLRAARPFAGQNVRGVDRAVLHRRSGAVSRLQALSARTPASGIGRRLGLALCRRRDGDGLSLGTDRSWHPDYTGSGVSRLYSVCCRRHDGRRRRGRFRPFCRR